MSPPGCFGLKAGCRVVAFVAILCSNLGCDANRVTATKSPVSQLKQLVRRDASQKTWENGGYKWKIAPGGISYDVTKSDSLVSPFIGQIRLKMLMFRPSGEEASFSGWTWIRFYRYEDSEWIADPIPGNLKDDGSVARRKKSETDWNAEVNSRLDAFLIR
jgi:hypothetical protein